MRWENVGSNVRELDQEREGNGKVTGLGVERRR